MNITDVVIVPGAVRVPRAGAASKSITAARTQEPAETTPRRAARPAPPERVAPEPKTVPDQSAVSLGFVENREAANAGQRLHAERTTEAVSQAIEALAARTEANQRASLRIRYDDDANRVVTQVLNREREVIRQLPPEDLLRIHARLKNLVGVLFDRRV